MTKQVWKLKPVDGFKGNSHHCSDCCACIKNGQPEHENPLGWAILKNVRTDNIVIGETCNSAPLPSNDCNDQVCALP